MVALGRFSTTGVLLNGFGFATPATPAASVYPVVLSEPADLSECVVIGSIAGVTAGGMSVLQNSDTSITVSTFNAAGAAGDRAFQLGVMRRDTVPKLIDNPFGQQWAAARVTAAGAYSGKTNGFAVSVAIGKAASVYTLTLARPISPVNRVSFVQVRGVAGGLATVREVSETIVEVSTFTRAGAAGDLEFDVQVLRSS
jgi:hypothetical protein